jgi:predicted dehydrogenase
MRPNRMKIAVVGVGHLGRHHARILATLPGAELVGVVDWNAERASEIAGQCGTHAFPDVSLLPPQTRGVVIAVPTESHHPVAMECLARGWDLLVEKPLASNARQGREIVEEARRLSRILQTGHTERYNPAVREALARVRQPRFIEVHRLGTFSERSLDVDVILDLMIHDLDIVLSLDSSGLESVAAVGVNALTHKMDIANARLAFRSGCVANLTASRISTERVRKIRIFQTDSYLSVDSALQELVHFKLEREGVKPTIVRVPSEVEKEEPLRAELQDFAGALEQRRAPLVTGEAGLAALELAEKVIQVIGRRVS